VRLRALPTKRATASLVGAPTSHRRGDLSAPQLVPLGWLEAKPWQSVATYPSTTPTTMQVKTIAAQCNSLTGC
jgi:hypothetical protein